MLYYERTVASRCSVLHHLLEMELLYYLSVVLPALLYLVYYYFTRTFNYWKSRGVLGPKPIPLFGNLKDQVLRKKVTNILFKEFYDEFPNEKVVGVYRMTTPALLIRDLDLIKHVMIKDFDMFVDRGVEFSKEGLGANLFHSDADTWRVLRNCFTPLFTTGKLKNMLYLMIERGDSFVDYIGAIVDKQPEQEVQSLMQRFTMTTIAACAFGLNVDTINEKIEVLKKIDNLVLNNTAALLAMEIDMMYPGIFKKLNKDLFPRFVKVFFDDLVKNVIKERNGVPTNRHDFMDIILELRQQRNIKGTKRNADDEQLTLDLTDDVIAAQAFVFYMAGYETSATTMTFLLFEMAKNPDIQEKLIAHIDKVLSRNNGIFNYETMTEMTYLERVIAETLRMYPVLDPLQRNAQEDYKLPGTTVTVKKGQTVVVSVQGIHYDEKYYPNPKVFDPDRWTAENSKDRHSCAYLPFGVGPRNCIGMRFAKFQSNVCLVKFFSNFRVEFSKNSKTDMEFNGKKGILGPKGGIHLNIIKRK